MGRAVGRERGALGHLDNREEISSVTVRARQAGGDSCLRQVEECSRRLDIYLAIICGRVGQSLAVRAQGRLASEGRVSQSMEFFLCVSSGCQILTGHRLGLRAASGVAVGPLPGPIQERCGGENIR